MREKLEHINGVEMTFVVAVGILVLLFGYRVKKIAFFAVWFLVGFMLTSYLMPMIAGAVPQIATSDLWRVLLPVCGGLLLALLGFTIEKICVAGATFAVAMLITVQYFGNDVQTLAIGAVVGVIAGAVAVRLMKPAIIIVTALAGAYVLTVGVLTWFPDINGDIFYFPMLGGLALIGAGFQFVNTKDVK